MAVRFSVVFRPSSVGLLRTSAVFSSWQSFHHFLATESSVPHSMGAVGTTPCSAVLAFYYPLYISPFTVKKSQSFSVSKWIASMQTMFPSSTRTTH